MNIRAKLDGVQGKCRLPCTISFDWGYIRGVPFSRFYSVYYGKTLGSFFIGTVFKNGRNHWRAVSKEKKRSGKLPSRQAAYRWLWPTA